MYQQNNINVSHLIQIVKALTHAEDRCVLLNSSSKKAELIMSKWNSAKEKFKSSQ